MTHIYEQQLLVEFYDNILSGKISKTQLEEGLEKGIFTESQLRVIEELSPVLGGLRNVGKAAMGGSIGNAFNQAKSQGLDKAAKGWWDKAKSAYSQGKNETQYQNYAGKIAKQWQGIDKTITRSRLFEQMEQFRKAFQGTDEYVDKSLLYINKAFLDLQDYLSKKYPDLNIQSDEQYTPEWKKRQLEQQRSIDAQTGVAGSQMRKKYRQDVSRNPGKPRNTLGNKIRRSLSEQ